MRTFSCLLKTLKSVSSSRTIVVVAVFSAALAVSSDVHADNQKDRVAMTACCGDDCLTAGCAYDAELYFSTNNNTCLPDCYLTALLIQPESTGTASCEVTAASSFRFVRMSSPCVEDGGDPFSLSFSLSSPFLVTNAQWVDIIDPTVVVEASTATLAWTVTGEKEKTNIGNSSNVPAASTWGLLALGVLVLSGGTLAIRNRWVQPTA